MIYLSVCPEFSDDWTEVRIEGPDESAVANVIASRLLAADWDVIQREDENG